MKNPMLIVAGAALLAAALPMTGCASTPAKADAAATKAGEGSCGGEKGKEGSCGGEKKAADGEKKAGEGSCGEGSCGGAPKN